MLVIKMVSGTEIRIPLSDVDTITEIEPETLAPSRSATALASSRVIFSSEPVNTIVWPPRGWPAATASIGSIVTSLTSASSAASLRGSAKKSAIASATTGPIPPTPDSSSAASSARAPARNESQSPKWRARRRALVQQG